MKIAVIGAGRIGRACVKLLSAIGFTDVVLMDAKQDAIDSVQLDAEKQLAGTMTEISFELKRRGIQQVICAVPFSSTLDIASAALSCGCSYIDFTEDVAAACSIRSLDPVRPFVTQTGLAPGLVTYIGLDLAKQVESVSELQLRVGALPQVSLHEARYAITWSSDGLVNEYLKSAVRKKNGSIEQVPSLDFYEKLVFHGIELEAFSTSGGIGDLSAYDWIPTVEYKTLRYPGHLQFIERLIHDTSFEEAVARVQKTFPRTREDVVFLLASVISVAGESHSSSLRIFPHDGLDLTALELSTAGTGTAVVELIAAGELPSKVLHAGEIPFLKIQQTRSFDIVKSCSFVNK